MKFRFTANQLLRSLTAVLIPALAVPAFGQANSSVPHELQGVDIIENLNAELPLDATFQDHTGRTIKLGDLFTGERPVLLQMGYLKCPQLCNLVLNEMTGTLQDMDWTTGDQFDVLSVSIAPDESHELAAAKRTSYVLMYDRRNSGKGWNFLVGPKENSQALADAIGFQFSKQPDGEYAHAAGLFVITPEGRVSRYLYGASHAPKTLRFALLEASDGRIGSTLDRFILWCHVYDPDSDSYVLFAVRLMQLGGALTLVILGTGLTWMWLADRRKSRAELESREPGSGVAVSPVIHGAKQ
ncbi:MAG: SCO family protein [Phycisphaerales bacterium]|nr:SCO family protein [Phycisphaerales bacterium]